jgi:hypothetical protein
MTRTKSKQSDPIDRLLEDPAVRDEGPRFSAWLENLLRNGERASGTISAGKSRETKTAKERRGKDNA